jgi:hypothetical protein
MRPPTEPNMNAQREDRSALVWLVIDTPFEAYINSLQSRNAALARFWPSTTKQMVLPRKHHGINALDGAAPSS